MITIISHMSASHDEPLVKLGRKKVTDLNGKKIICDVYQFPPESFIQGIFTWNFGRNTLSKMFQDVVRYRHIKLLHRQGKWWLCYEEKPTETGTGSFDQPEGAIGWFECSGR